MAQPSKWVSGDIIFIPVINILLNLFDYQLSVVRSIIVSWLFGYIGLFAKKKIDRVFYLTSFASSNYVAGKALRENSPFRETRITMATGLKIPDAMV
jgi:hypothetical protein